MIDVLFVVLPHTVLLDLAGPAEAFRITNQTLSGPLFRLRFVGPDKQLVSSIGIGLNNIEPLPEKFDATAEQTWVVLLGLPGRRADEVMKLPAWQKTRRWLSKIFAPELLRPEQKTFKLLSVCVGAILAADAGLLAHRQCTTHHEILDDLAQLAPTAKVISNRVFIEDGPVISSAGITAGIDLALHLIATQCGATVASTVAQVMVAFTRRGPLDPSQSPLLKYRDHIHPAVHRVQDAVCADPKQPWTTADMAMVGFVTQRHLLRLFTEYAGLSPRDYAESVRVAIAQHALDKGLPALKAAELSGLNTVRRLREALSKTTKNQLPSDDAPRRW
jgi:transcriptional regulator GlxA family with amidase domain